MGLSDQLTRELAARAGVSPTWRDMSGKERPVSVESLRALLAALDCPAAHDDEIRNSLAALDAGIAAAANQAGFVTARVGQPIPLPVRGAPGERVEIAFEGGETRVIASVDGFGGALTLPPPDRPGYHRARLKSGEFTVATAPRRCLSMLDVNAGRRGWGIAAQIYSLGSGVECGIGDFGGVADLASASARLGADLLAISPVHATLGVPERFNSPYSASSRLYFDPVYADPMLSLPRALTDEAANAATRTQNTREWVDWPAARQAKTAVFKSAFALLSRAGAPLRAEFAAFEAAASDALKAHALFEAIRAELPLPWDWRDWPEGLRGPSAADARAFARERPDALSFQVFLQWITSRSCAAAQALAKQAGMSVGLIADVAAGIDPAGSDAWARPNEVLRGVTLGAPPDFFTPAGQDWRLTSFSPQGLAASGFAPYIDTLRACLAPVGGLRIDHVMGAQRLWLIPEGAGPTEGAYVRFPAETLFRLIALESWRRGAIVIGEDLGTLPLDFQDYVAEQGVTGMRMLRIERDAHAWKSPSQWSRSTAALTATHDVMATAGWWKGVDFRGSANPAQEEERRAVDRKLLWEAFCEASVAGGEPPRPEDASPVVDAAFAFIAKTPCEIKLVALEDVLATDIQPNVPGTTKENPNWRHRFTQPAPELLSRPGVVARLARLEPPREREAS